MNPSPRIALLHALKESQAPAWNAFDRGWPEASIFNLLDDSLAPDLARLGHLSPAMTERFLALGRYAAGVDADTTRTDAILFTCSAFGPAIEAVQRELPIPVLRPNEAAFEAALDRGNHIALVTTFPRSMPPLVAELQELAEARRRSLTVTKVVIERALVALRQGDGQLHDRIAAEAASELTGVDVVVLCQFSLARALPSVTASAGRPVLTTPDSAVAKLKSLLAARGG